MNGQALLITLVLAISGIIVLIQVLQMSAISDFVKRQGEWNHRQDVAVAAIAARIDALTAGVDTLEDNLALDGVQAHTEQVTKLLEALVTKKPDTVTSQIAATSSSTLSGANTLVGPKPAA